MPAKSMIPKKTTKTAKTKSATTKKAVKSTPASEVSALRTEVNDLRARLDSLTHVLHTEFRTQMRHGTRHVAKRLAQEGLVDND
jgi:hypothetical protein